MIVGMRIYFKDGNEDKEKIYNETLQIIDGFIKYKNTDDQVFWVNANEVKRIKFWEEN